MRPLLSQKPRATRADAQAFRRDGVGSGMSGNDYLSDEERLAIAEEVQERLQAMTQTHFPRTQNLEYALLKSHLIVEYALTQFIRCTSVTLIDVDKLQFTFAQKLNIAVLHGLGLGCATTVPSIEILNQIRNQVAHRFSFDRQALMELIANNTDDRQAKVMTDRQCVSFLRSYCNFVCGQIAGHIKATIFMTQRA